MLSLHIQFLISRMWVSLAVCMCVSVYVLGGVSLVFHMLYALSLHYVSSLEMSLFLT